MSDPIQLYTGDVLACLSQLPDNSVNCCVTSPPYWGLRDYGVEGQIGLEASPQEFVAKMVAVFAEVRRVLRPDGTCWVNLGDTYASAWPCNRRNVVGTGSLENGKRENRAPRLGGLKEKDLCGIPWRVAFALQDDGWYLRQDIIWSKSNPMPESVRDRCTKAHEYIFLLTKSERYAYDQDAIRTPFSGETKALSFETMDYKRRDGYAAGFKTPDGWDTTKGEGGHGSFHKDGREKGKVSVPDAYKGSLPGRQDGPGQDRRSKNDRSDQRTKKDLNGNWDNAEASGNLKGGANRRSVWTVPTKAYPEAHFATFPDEIPRLCILAGCPEGGTVLDPFAGSGTTLAVALALGRNGIGIELNPEYVALIRKRIAGVTPGFDFS